jgi:hypothetical protein
VGEVELFLNSVPILNPLTKQEKLRLLDAFEEKEYGEGDQVGLGREAKVWNGETVRLGLAAGARHVRWRASRVTCVDPKLVAVISGTHRLVCTIPLTLHPSLPLLSVPGGGGGRGGGLLLHHPGGGGGGVPVQCTGEASNSLQCTGIYTPFAVY